MNRGLGNWRSARAAVVFEVVAGKFVSSAGSTVLVLFSLS